MIGKEELNALENLGFLSPQKGWGRGPKGRREPWAPGRSNSGAWTKPDPPPKAVGFAQMNNKHFLNMLDFF